MNMQELMKQAQKMQQGIMNIKEKINAKEFIGTSSIVEVKMNGKKEVLSVEIKENIDLNTEKEVLEDMLVIAFNNASESINKELEEKIGPATSGLGDLL